MIDTLKNILRIISIIFLLGFLFLQFNSYTKAATDGVFRMAVPNSGNLIQGCSYSADIRVNSGTNNSNAADAIILFDPSKIEILDSLPAIAGTQIKPGVAYEVYPSAGNLVDQTNGIIRLSGVSLSSNFNGEDIFGTIQFRSKPGATNGTFTIRFDGLGATLDSNIAETNTSTDVLGSKVDANFTFSPGSCISDTTPPNIIFITPTNNQSNVPINSNITINLTDNLSGVNVSTLEIFVNGVPYNSLSPQLTITGTPTNYSLLLDPIDLFYSNSPSNILVRVRDFSGNLRQSTISFNYPQAPTPSPTPSPTPVVPDLIAPTIEFVTPITNQTIQNNSDIVVVLRDEGSGINLNNLILFVNDKRYTVSDSTVFSTGNPNEYRITIRDNINFSRVSSSYFSVFVTDLSGNAASGNIIFNIPENVVQEDQNKVCPTHQGNNNIPTCPTVSAPLSPLVNQVQESIVNALPEALKPLASEGGFLGLASVVALLPLFVQGLLTIGSLILGGFLWPLIYALIVPASKKLGKVVDDFTKEGISLVKITVYEKLTGQEVRKAYTDFSGKYFMHLDPGVYVFKLENSDYNITQVEAQISEPKDLDFVFEMAQKESGDIGEQIQFKVFGIDPKLLTVYFALILTAINLVYIRGLFALILFLIVFALAGFFTFTKFKNKKFSKSSN